MRLQRLHRHGRAIAGLVVVLSFIMAGLLPVGSAQARKLVLFPARGQGRLLTFRLQHVRARRIRSAWISVGARRYRVALRLVRRGARRGVVRIAVPHRRHHRASAHRMKLVLDLGPTQTRRSSNANKKSKGSPGTSPAPAPAPAPTPAPAPSPGVVIGIGNGAGWGSGAVATLRAAGIQSARDQYDGAQRDYNAGYRNNSFVVGDTPDGTDLNQIDTTTWAQSAAAEIDQLPPGTLDIEVGNEMSLKGGCGRPAKYAQMFTALASLRPSANLVFSSFGDYYNCDTKTWSQDVTGHGWLGDALAAERSLVTSIKGFVAHPYGVVGNNRGNDWGASSFVAEHDYAATLGFANADKWYLTEYGVKINGGSDCSNVSTQQAQASCLTAAYDYFLGFPYVRGIWWYEARDDSSGNWGVLNSDNTGRPSLTALAGYARRYAF